MPVVYSSPIDSASLLSEGRVGVCPTDTVYGLLGLAQHETAVERIYRLKGRDEHKPFIVLISSLADLTLLRIELPVGAQKALASLWPGPNSIALPCASDAFSYLHRGKNSIAFRLPHDPELLELLRITGPLVAPSANPQGLPPANDLINAQSYFSDTVDFYVDGGTLDGKPSSVYTMASDATLTQIR